MWKLDYITILWILILQSEYIPHEPREHSEAEQEITNNKVMIFDQDINCDILIFVQNLCDKTWKFLSCLCVCDIMCRYVDASLRIERLLRKAGSAKR